MVRTTRLTIELQPDPRLDPDCTLAARIRGAFGSRLAAEAERDAQCFGAWEVLFPEKANPANRNHSPAPFVIAADPSLDGGLLATLTLFGVADRWRDASFRAFIDALSSPPGLSLKPPSKISMTVPLSVRSSRWTRNEGVQPPSRANQARISFATPVMFGPQDRLSERFGDIIVGLAERISHLAHYCGCRFDARLGFWREATNRMGFQTRGLRPVEFRLWSSGGGPRTCLGWIGDLLIADPDPEVLALLAIGQVTGCGRNAAKGFGRYHLYTEA